ncbi:hypothetical protein, partial [Bacillus subtilis]|uniref:hypothetical protein n=1 Tax=Bacillus subtilis TaxID=1423 RepID=UPI0011A19C9E
MSSPAHISHHITQSTHLIPLHQLHFFHHQILHLLSSLPHKPYPLIPPPLHMHFTPHPFPLLPNIIPIPQTVTNLQPLSSLSPSPPTTTHPL